MSYEYKEVIQTAMGAHINNLNILDDALEELDHVYAQADRVTKAEALKKQNSILLGKMDTLKTNLNYYKKQAAKAGEYEAKAQAFDEIFKLYIGYEDGWMSFPRGHKSFNKALIDVCKQYERGEQDE